MWVSSWQPRPASRSWEKCALLSSAPESPPPEGRLPMTEDWTPPPRLTISDGSARIRRPPRLGLQRAVRPWGSCSPALFARP